MAIINGTAGAETLTGTAGNDTITGKGGNDTAFMGGGDDTFVWNDGDGSDKVEGQAGFDTLRFTGSGDAEVIDILANGTRARLTRDVDLVTMNLNGVERINLRALGGEDGIRVKDLTGTAVQQVAIDLAGTVGGTVEDGADDVVFRYGTTGNDIINVALVGGKIAVTGLSAQVTISHAGSHDTLVIDGLEGNDIINASQMPADVIELAVFGGAGNDKIIGGKSNDYLSGDGGNDTIVGGADRDFLFGGAGNDLFVWNAGNGNDQVDGEGDFDTLRFTGSAADEVITLVASGAEAQLKRNIGAATIYTDEVERLEVRALGGADNIMVGDLSGTAVTQVAIDLAAKVGGILADTKVDRVTINCTANDDIVDIAWSGGKIVTAGLAAEVSIAHSGATDVLAIDGGLGNNILIASGLVAGKMSLQLLGGDGNDVLFGSAGADAVRGGTGNDIAFLGAGDDVFFWNAGDGNDAIDGQAGFDTLQWKGGNSSENINILASGEQVEISDFVSAVDLNNVERIRVHAGGGSDVVGVYDLAGTDVKQVAIDLALTGAVGDGLDDEVNVYGTDGSDKITVAISGGAVSVTGLSAQVTVAHVEVGDDLFIRGEDGNDIINASTVPAGTLRLVLWAGVGNDVVTGGAGSDSLDGDFGNDTVRGAGGSDLLDGGNGNDRLLGGAGDDRLYGGAGNDTITGGAGNDTIYHESFLHGVDVILDFDGDPAGGQDTLDLDGLFDSLTIATANRMGRLFLDDNGTTVDVYVDINGNGTNLLFATLHTTDEITKGADVIVGTL